MGSLSSIRLCIDLAWKAKFWLVSSWLIATLVAIVILSAQFSGRQPATVGLDVGISFIRIYMTVLIAMLSQELLSKELERRYYLYSLSYPISKESMLFMRMISIYFIALLVLLFSMLVLASTVTFISSTYEQSKPISLGGHYLIVFSFLAFDLAVISAFSGLLAVVSKTPGFVLIGTLGFAILSRSYSSVISLLGGDRIVVDDPERYQEALSVLGYILPNLGLLDVRQVSLYGDLSFLPDNVFAVLVSPAIYLAIVILLAVWVFKKRRLN